jgi:sodium-dependent phosphate cotransporter
MIFSLDRLYPLLLGANVGSSFTGILAALSADPIKLRETLQIALCETLCNIFGVLMFYPIPFLRKLPMSIAMTLGDVTAQYRWFSILYIVLFFFVTPASLLALSLFSTHAMISVLALLIGQIILIVTINWLQVRVGIMLT